MKKYIILTIAMTLYLFQNISSQTTTMLRDPQISEMVKEISSENIEFYIRKLVSFDTRHTFSDTLSDESGIGAARRWVKSEFERFGEESEDRLEVVLDAFTLEPDGRRILESVVLKNVMATLKGTDTEDDRIFLISGHLDSRAGRGSDSEIIAPGANDDASGVAMLMELARIMSKRKFPATIIFLAVTGEEQGLYGAKYMAGKAREENWNIVAMLNNDMIGNSFSSKTFLNDNMRVRVFSEGIPAFETEEMARMRRYIASENDSKSRQLARYTKEIGERYVDQLNVTLIYRKDRFLRGGDHTAFSNQGFTTVRICEFNENYDYQHQDVKIENGKQYGDLPEFVDFEYVRKIGGINLATLANLNLAPDVPKNVVIDIRLSNSTSLSWEEPEGKKPAGYYVLLRETYQPFWAKKIFVEATEITLPYSKDNYFFAVQSVDKEGHESMAVLPVPKR